MVLKKAFRIAVHLAVFSLPLTYNACGSAFNSLPVIESSSDTLGAPLLFNRASITQATRSDVSISGSCVKGLPVSIKVDVLAAISLNCATGEFKYDAKLPGADGPKIIVARLLDSKAREHSDSVTVIKDTVAPSIQILNMVAKDNDVIITGSCENSLPITAAADIQSITSPTCSNNMFQVSASLVVKAGARTLELAQTDKAGNRGSASQMWNPDLTPPALSLTAPAPNSYVGATTTLAGVCEAGLAISVSGSALAQAQQVNCPMGTFSLNVNVQGTGNFVVSQTDSSGNKAEASVTVTKDIVAPSLTITAPTANQTITSSSVTVSGACETGLPVVISGSGVGAQTQVNCANSAYSSSVVLSSGNGSKVIDVKQTDLAGNSSALSRTISKSAPASMLTIAQPAAGSSSKASITLSGACDNTSTISFSGDIASATNVTCSNGAYSKALTFSSAEGAKTVTVKQTLNSVESLASRNFVKDSVAPSVSITQPLANAVITEANFMVVGTCESSIGVVISGAGLTSSVNAACTNGAFSAAVVSTANDGAKAFSVSQTDLAGNTGSVSRSVDRDSSPPVLNIASPANNSAVKANITIAGACETGLVVALSGAGLSQSINASCSGGMFSQAVTLSSGEGSKAISAKQTDIAGNTATKNLTVIKDTLAPTITITGPAAQSKSETGLTITGACETGLSVKASGGVASEVTGSCASQAYSINVIFSSGDGSKTIIISQTDAAGNTSSVQREFQKGAVVVPGAAFTAAKTALNNYCTTCHKPGGSASYADLTMATEDEFAAKGFVVPGQPQTSKLVFRMLYYQGTYMGAANMPLGSNTSTFPRAAYDSIVNWIQNMQTGPVIPPITPTFTCTDPNLKAPTLSYTLTKVQYVNTLNDLFGTTIVNKAADQIGTLPTEAYSESTHRRSNVIGVTNVEAYFGIAKTIAAAVVDDSTKLTAVFGSCASGATPAATCIDTYLNNFAKKIYRRPLTSAEITFAKNIANRGGDYKANLKTVLGLHLQSPAFIWRLELGNTSQTSTTQTDLTPYEVASRISYMAADTGPDDALLTAAANNQLATIDQVKAQVRRILTSAAGREKMKRTLLRWSMNDKAMDFSALPAFSGININGLGTAMVTEAGQYVDYMVYTQNASFKALLTSQVSFASNASLANIYGHSAVASGSMGSFTGRRQGLLMRAPFYAAPRTRTGIIRRGVDFQKRFLCNEIPAPTSSVVDMRDDDALTFEEKLAYSNKDSIAHQTRSQLCMSCHATINPTGFAFENLDPFGKIRSTESIYDLNNQLVRTAPISTAGDVPLPGGGTVPVQDGYDLVTFVANSSEGTSCFSRNAFRAMFERHEATEDYCQLDTVQKAIIDSNKSILDSYVELISNSNITVKKN